MELFSYIITVFSSIFFVVNPLGNAPIFLAITEGVPAAGLRSIVKRASLTMAGILTLFALGGQSLLEVFRISLPAVRISGGMILFLIAFKMLQAERVKIKSLSQKRRVGGTRK